MKVLFVAIDTRSNFCLLNYYQQDYQALLKTGHKVTIVNSLYDFRILGNYDLYFIWWWTYAFLFVGLAKLFKKKSIITGTLNLLHHSSQHFTHYNIRNSFHKRLISWSIKHASTNLLVSTRESILFPKFFSGKHVYYPHTSIAVPDQLPNYNLNPDVFNLLNITWSGKQNLQRKNVFNIISAFTLVCDSGCQATLTLAGAKGDGFSSLIDCVQTSKYREHIFILPDIPESSKNSLFASSHIYIQPSYYEGFGLAILEAMTFGLPVVISDPGEFIQGSATGLVRVPPDDIREIASSIIRIIKDPIHREELHVESLKVSKSFAFETKLERLRDIIASL